MHALTLCVFRQYSLFVEYKPDKEKASLRGRQVLLGNRNLT